MAVYAGFNYPCMHREKKPLQPLFLNSLKPGWKEGGRRLNSAVGGQSLDVEELSVCGGFLGRHSHQ